MPKHPFLDLANLPAWSELSPDLIKSEISNALERSEERLQNIRSLSPQESNFNNSVKALEQATIYLDHAWGLVGHLDSVCNSPELRTAHNEMLPKVSAFGAKIPLDEKLWQVIRCFSEKPEVQDLSPIDHRLLDETIADFRNPVLIYLRKKKTVSKKYHPNLPKLPSNSLNGFSMPQIHGN